MDSYCLNSPSCGKGWGEVLYLASAYLAPVQYYTKLLHYPKIVIDRHEHYVKQSYRNRCNIAAANGIQALSIPTDKGSELKCAVKDMRIAPHADWQKNHWKSIEAAYNSTPFFEYYKDDFIPFYEKKWDFLFDFNTELQAVILNLLDINPNIEFSSEYETTFGISQKTPAGIDLREEIHPKKKSADTNFSPLPYYQVFDEKFGFIPNLSIIDLLFNMGNEALLVLYKSYCIFKKKL